jgi:sorbitol-specific phosphotransferase system component IIA
MFPTEFFKTRFQEFLPLIIVQSGGIIAKSLGFNIHEKGERIGHIALGFDGNSSSKTSTAVHNGQNVSMTFL